jgi:formylglycine-generating enzyme required for sulfatase activity
VVVVTWYEALAYCEWLDKQLSGISKGFSEQEGLSSDDDAFWQGLAAGKLHLTLPSEAEWEKAARGVDGQVYPWKGKFDLRRANTSEVGIGSTSAVGCFPDGQSPYGLLDMSGNVWEWTRSLWGKDWQKPDFKYPYNPGDPKREDLKAGKAMYRSLRGGSFNYNSGDARCASRGRYNPDLRYHIIGFRIVVSPLFLA